MDSLSNLKQTLEKIILTKSLEERRQILLAHLGEGFCESITSKLDLEREVIALSIKAIGQENRIFRNNFNAWEPLLEIERFYFEEGGIFGYHVRALTLIFEKKEESRFSIISPPRINVSENEKTDQAIIAAIKKLANLAIMHPVGGLGDRLNLRSKSGSALPVALLPFLGKTLLELLVRDIAALEYLYYKFFDEQITIPIAFMTSHIKENDQHIRAFLSQKRWFSRPKKSFFLFPQISVPVIAENGLWAHTTDDALNFQPGGHGAIWRTADCKGVFDFLIQQDKNYILVRQVNNPLAAIGSSLLALFGFGVTFEKSFGIASCPREKGAAEGALALIEKEKVGFSISNIEYTDFERTSLDKLIERGVDLPANTNLLFADLKKLLPFIRKNPLPASTFNRKSDVLVSLESGEKCPMKGGRLESMMQNISDFLISESKETLPSFLTYQPREKIMGAVKRSSSENGSLLETPEGAFFELLKCNYHLLESISDLPPFCTQEEYLKTGPSLLFLYHPALGPLFEIIRKKILRGKIFHNSEINLEIADLYMEDCTIDGSLLIFAENVMGEKRKEGLRYGEETGKCYLKNVSFQNQGIDRKAKNVFWQGSIRRKEKFNLKILGNGEFFAANVHFQGEWNLTIPSGERWVAIANEEGGVSILKEKIEGPSWGWVYQFLGNKIDIMRQGDISRIIALRDRQFQQQFQ